MRVRTVLSILGVMSLVVGALLLFYYPAIPRSAAGWIALIALGLPAWIFLEWGGEALGRSWLFKGRSSTFRVLMGVPVITVFILGTMFLVRAVQLAVMTF